MEVIRQFEQEQHDQQQRQQKITTPIAATYAERLQRIRRSQAEYSKMFTEFNSIVAQVKIKYAIRPITPMSSSSGASSMSVSGDEDHAEVPSQALKRKWRENDLMENTSIKEDVQSVSEPEFPKLLLNGNMSMVVLGPNGTQIESHLFYAVNWSSGAAATRCLLSLVFSSDVLSTHTLTGKPSPAFYGRERPPKMQLDPLITADVIHCVLTKCGCNEREVRAAITTKCADTAKKYKRRLLKLQHQLQQHQQELSEEHQNQPQPNQQYQQVHQQLHPQ